MKLQFNASQDYQTRAVNAVVGVFAGQPLANSEYCLDQNPKTIHNVLSLTSEQILTNLQAIQAQNGVGVSDELIGLFAEADQNNTASLNFSIEMETGTGKTYTFIKTIYELNKVYGFKKFVIVVPSVAIREGTIKNLQITNDHFQSLYERPPLKYEMYDSKKLNALTHFSDSDNISILVINIDSFTKDNNKINQVGEKPFAPIEYIRRTCPIVIVDEPQNFETDIRRKAIFDLNPLCTLRYSATHKNPYNLLYSLNPVQAYDLGLVKQIEVDGVLADANYNEAFIELIAIEKKKRSDITAKVKIYVDDKTGVKAKEMIITRGDDLYQKSNQRSLYANGFIVESIDAQEQEIEFSNKIIIGKGQVRDGLNDDVMRYQIERTVAAHFAKLKKLKPLGIKVLSLFFIDKVANYRHFDEQGNPSLSQFGAWFEDAFNKYAQMKAYQDLIPHTATAVHNGYFSGDKKGKGAQAKTVWIDSKEGGTKKDDDTYALIMKDKERLLSFDEPLQFIFSHSALREGWDNPNVFQICTLNESKTALKKRQEIGRGLRLCVNQAGVRVEEKAINVLTVVANESYDSFARSLQNEIEEDAGVNFDKRIKNARAKARMVRKQLNPEETALFGAIWEKINFKTRYSVKLNSSELIEKCIQNLTNFDQYPKVNAPKIKANKVRISMDHEGIHTQEISSGQIQTVTQHHHVPNVYRYIQDRIHISRGSLYAILEGSGRLGELFINPQQFLDTVTYAIKQSLQQLLVDGIEYQKINGKHYEMSLFEVGQMETYLSSLYPSQSEGHTTPLNKTVYEACQIDESGNAIGNAFDCVLSDSEAENQFAHDCSVDEHVRFFFKLPSKFKIPTPLGTYNPDWAVVFENDSRVYFVAETKSTLIEAERRVAENLKIKCGKKHFGLSDNVVYKTVTRLDELIE